MRRSCSGSMRSGMHNGRRVARWGSIRGVRRPLAPLQCASCDGLTGCWRRQIRVRLVHLVVVFPVKPKRFHMKTIEKFSKRFYYATGFADRLVNLDKHATQLCNSSYKVSTEYLLSFGSYKRKTKTTFKFGANKVFSDYYWRQI